MIYSTFNNTVQVAKGRSKVLKWQKADLSNQVLNYILILYAYTHLFFSYLLIPYNSIFFQTIISAYIGPRNVTKFELQNTFRSKFQLRIRWKSISEQFKNRGAQVQCTHGAHISASFPCYPSLFVVQGQLYSHSAPTGRDALCLIQDNWSELSYLVTHNTQDHSSVR